MKPRHSMREEQIISLLLQGMTNAEIGKELGVKERTVKSYMNRLFIKHDIHDERKINRVVLAVMMYQERNDPTRSTR